MNIPHRSRVYQVPEEELIIQLNIPKDIDRHQPLGEIAEQTNGTIEDFLTQVRQIITQYQSTYQPISPPPPPQ